MLQTADETPLWGFIPYKLAVPLLLGLALSLTGLLVFSLDHWYSTVTDRLLLGDPTHIPGSDLFKLALISVMLGATAIVSTLILQRYRTTQRELTHVQVLSRNILENMVGGVVTLDLSGRTTVANPAACQMLDLSSDQQELRLEVLTSRHAEMGNVIRAALDKHEYVQDVDFRYSSASTALRWLRVTASPLLNNDHRKDGVVVLVKDVTRLRAMEEQLRRADRLAVTETMAAGVAHEIRNPLSAIDLNLRLLKDEVHSNKPNSEEIQSYFDILTSETRRLNRITDDFLAFARPRAGSRRQLVVGDVIRRVLRLIDSEASVKKIRLRPETLTSLPSVYGDPERLEQVFLNILVNALESMPNGGEIRVRGEIYRADKGEFVEVNIADRGSGIDEDVLPRIFDPYFTTKATGTGLGLAIVHRIVTDHGGDIVFESAPGRGTVARVRLPAQTSGIEEPSVNVS